MMPEGAVPDNREYKEYDCVILGGGLYGLYAARLLSGKGKRVLVLEKDPTLMRRATKINQARVHGGYHYPRSLSTAVKSAHYYRRFHDDFSFCIHDGFRQIYATSAQFSWTDRDQFVKFCADAGIPCSEENPHTWFRPGSVDGAFLTEEDTYDADILRDFYIKELGARADKVTIITSAQQDGVRPCDDLAAWDVSWRSSDSTSGTARTPMILNATYASTNQILTMVNTGLEERNTRALPLFPIKYELCEIILCRPGNELLPFGITVMDGPFFSIMPFGKSGFHSLTAVTHTPNAACREDLPSFACQGGSGAVSCSPLQLDNCDDCPHRPASAWPYMQRLADKYLLPGYTYEYHSSLFSMKPIMRSAEVDDSRPTAIREDRLAGGARLISVLSGKINTVYDLDEFL